MERIIERRIDVDGCGPRVLGATRSMGIGAVLIAPDGSVQETRRFRHISYYATNNFAEFLALELGLQMAVEHDKGDDWVIYTDSTYTRDSWYEPGYVKKPHLVPIVHRWHELAAKIDWRVSVRWIDSADNKLADAASREGILLEDYFGDMSQ